MTLLEDQLFEQGYDDAAWLMDAYEWRTADIRAELDTWWDDDFLMVHRSPTKQSYPVSYLCGFREALTGRLNELEATTQ